MNEVAQNEPRLLPVTQQQAEAWVNLAKAKNELTFTLQLKELSAQKILLPVKDSGDYKAIDAALADYRKAHTDMVNHRKQFTNMINDNVVQPLMEYERRVDPQNSEEYKLLAGASLNLRKEEKEKVDRINALNQEKAQFKIHVENEFSRVAAIYRGQLGKLIQEAYQSWLKAGLQEPDIPKLKEILAGVQVQPVNKFQPRYLTVEMMTEIFQECDRPDYAGILSETEYIIERTFASYSSDLANAEAAIQHSKEQAALAEMEEKRKAEEEAALNTLINTAETVQVEEPKIKRNVVVEVIESEQWAKAVMAAFITHLPHLTKYLRVKSWSNLKIGQMADYLGKYATDSGEAFNSLTLKEIEK